MFMCSQRAPVACSLYPLMSLSVIVTIIAQSSTVCCINLIFGHILKMERSLRCSSLASLWHQSYSPRKRSGGAAVIEVRERYFFPVFLFQSLFCRGSEITSCTTFFSVACLSPSVNTLPLFYLSLTSCSSTPRGLPGF